MMMSTIFFISICLIQNVLCGEPSDDSIRRTPDLKCRLTENIIETKPNHSNKSIPVEIEKKDEAQYTVGMTETVSQAYSWLNKGSVSVNTGTFKFVNGLFSVGPEIGFGYEHEQSTTITREKERKFDTTKVFSVVIKSTHQIEPNDTLYITQWSANCADETNLLGFELKLNTQLYYQSKHAKEIKHLKAHGLVRGIRSMASQKMLILDQENRIVAMADDPRSASEFSIHTNDGYFFSMKVFRPNENSTSGEWHDICPSRDDNPYFAVCNSSNADVIVTVEEPIIFKKVCYSHWHGVPGYSNCDVFGIEYSGTGSDELLTVASKGTAEQHNHEALLRADGGQNLRRLGVNDYHKTFMFIDPTEPDNADGQWKNYVLMHSGVDGNFPVHHQSQSLKADRVSLAKKLPLVRRFVNRHNQNQFQIVRNAKKEPNEDTFLCPTYDGLTKMECHDNQFTIEVVEENEGIELFRLHSVLNNKYIILDVHNDSKAETQNNASKFYLIDEPKDFFVVQLFKTPFHAINKDKDGVTTYIAADHSTHNQIPNIDDSPISMPTMIRIPLNYSLFKMYGTEHTNLDYLSFENYTQTTSEIPATTNKDAALFHLVYNPQKFSFSLKFINIDEKTRWLCFLPTPSKVKRKDGFWNLSPYYVQLTAMYVSDGANFTAGPFCQFRVKRPFASSTIKEELKLINPKEGMARVPIEEKFSKSDVVGMIDSSLDFGTLQLKNGELEPSSTLVHELELKLDEGAPMHKPETAQTMPFDYLDETIRENGLLFFDTTSNGTGLFHLMLFPRTAKKTLANS